MRLEITAQTVQLVSTRLGSRRPSLRHLPQLRALMGLTSSRDTPGRRARTLARFLMLSQSPPARNRDDSPALLLLQACTDYSFEWPSDVPSDPWDWSPTSVQLEQLLGLLAAGERVTEVLQIHNQGSAALL